MVFRHVFFPWLLHEKWEGTHRRQMHLRVMLRRSSLFEEKEGNETRSAYLLSYYLIRETYILIHDDSRIDESFDSLVNVLIHI